MNTRLLWRRTCSVSLALAASGALLVGLMPPVAARITGITFTTITSPALGGRSFGSAGQYEQLDGTATGEIDPNDGANALIQDIDLAPRNARGMVEYSMAGKATSPLASRSNCRWRRTTTARRSPARCGRSTSSTARLRAPST